MPTLPVYVRINLFALPVLKYKSAVGAFKRYWRHHPATNTCSK
jgi:hypothetical protein